MREKERGGHEVGSVKREDGWKGMTWRSSKEGWYGGESRVDMGRKVERRCDYLTLTSEAPTSSRAFANRISFTSTSAIYTT